MKYTIVATEAVHHEGDAYKVTNYTMYNVLGTVDALDTDEALEKMAAQLKLEGKTRIGKVIVLPGEITEIVDGYIY